MTWVRSRTCWRESKGLLRLGNSYDSSKHLRFHPSELCDETRGQKCQVARVCSDFSPVLHCMVPGDSGMQKRPLLKVLPTYLS